MKTLKYAVVAVFTTIIAVSCGNNETDNFATGTFEATEVTVSAEQD